MGFIVLIIMNRLVDGQIEVVRMALLMFIVIKKMIFHIIILNFIRRKLWLMKPLK